MKQQHDGSQPDPLNRPYTSTWGDTNSNFSGDRQNEGGGYSGPPGSNYGAGSFSGAAFGRGLEEDKYRGYDQRAGFSGYNDPDYRQQSGRDRGGYDQTGYGNEERDRRSYSGSYDRPVGPHRGKGPKGYKRSDERIREDVHEALYQDPHVDASHVEVRVDDGEVVLSGRVENRDARRRAEDLAERISGVQNVSNRLRIGQSMLENAAHAITAAIGDVTLGSDISRVDHPTPPGEEDTGGERPDKRKK